MKPTELKKALATAVTAARAAGDLMRRNQRSPKKVNSETQHDIKLELDVRCQKVIEKILLGAFPGTAMLGEEGVAGDFNSPLRWVVDPIDGTVNFSYEIPHCCVSIALQEAVETPAGRTFRTVVGVVYDPFCDELWTAIRGQKAKLNGRAISVSNRKRTTEAIVAIGFSKSKSSLQQNLPYFNRLAPRVRKVRIMGSAALSLTYVASGRFDAYVEGSIHLWDIAAGGLIVECAGGEMWAEPMPKEHTFRMLADNGHLRKALQKLE